MARIPLNPALVGQLQQRIQGQALPSPVNLMVEARDQVQFVFGIAQAAVALDVNGDTQLSAANLQEMLNRVDTADQRLVQAGLLLATQPEFATLNVNGFLQQIALIRSRLTPLRRNIAAGLAKLQQTGQPVTTVEAGVIRDQAAEVVMLIDTRLTIPITRTIGQF